MCNSKKLYQKALFISSRHRQNQEGQILVEALIAIAIAAILIVSVSQFITASITSNEVSGLQTEASTAATEGMEVARAIAEDNYNDIYKLSKGAANPYHPEHAPGGSWTLVAGSDTPYDGITREIIIENVSRSLENGGGDIVDVGGYDDPSTQKITVSISGSDFSGLEIVEYITRNANSIWPQEDWQGGDGQANWSDTTMFDTSTDIDYTTQPGSLILEQN